ncbi:acyl carrier protein [Anaeroplasma bactoclasticum]|jgi:acyl carrier protein|uniref:Acyl carrier protein n=1 Tax=Anaeroplasma bactoclasticum TaxID=2088 RepID=A0A397R3H2_9MOLU|nr:phosphopantetheine-binding protein [Anaeroplasma bactoclasticum]RIA64961.1 acyl carrier protein [Anaeroplasma bactoclasticum]
MEEIKQQLKDFIVDELGVDPDELQFDTPLFGEGIGLDSIDSIEIISFVDETFGVSMNGVDKTNFLSIDTIAAYVADHQ